MKRWLLSVLGFRFKAPPEFRDPPPAPNQKSGANDLLPLTGGFPEPPLALMKDTPPQEQWRLMLDHYKATLDLERARIERLKALSEWDKVTMERAKLAFENEKLRRQWYLDSSRAVYEYGRYAINCALLMNGGAAVALIAHIASAKDEVMRVPFSVLASPLKFFAFGVAAAASCAALSYLAQASFTHDYQKTGTTFQCSAILAWFVSFGSFLFAVDKLAAAFPI